MTVRNRVSVLGAGILASLMVAGQALAQDTPKGDAGNGKKLFETIGCFECHGFAGQGGAGPKLIDPPVFPAYIIQLRTPRNVMPPYTAKVLTDQQAADIYAHLQQFQKGPDAKSIPLLQN